LSAVRRTVGGVIAQAMAAVTPYLLLPSSLAGRC